MADRLEIFRLMGVPPKGIGVLNVQLILFGKVLVLDCLYDPEEPKYFKMRFEDCTKIIWEIIDDELDERDRELDVIGIHLSDNVSQESTVIHTDAAEYVIRHNKPVQIEKIGGW